MRPLIRFAFFASLTCMAAILPVLHDATAQDGPRLQVLDARGQNITDTADLTVDFDESFNIIDNPYLADAMLLNYQISLLEKMAERQAEILKISDSFKAMGLPFEEPAPSVGLCKQLPPNAPCIRHYPDLYQPLVSQRKAHYSELQSRASGMPSVSSDDPQARERARKMKEEQERRLAEAKARAAALERATRYQWNDVTCVAGNCTGIITGQRMPGYRATVRKGTRLADGTLVSGIDTHGITVIIDGDRIALRPAPQDSDTSATTATGPAPAVAARPSSVTPVSEESDMPPVISALDAQGAAPGNTEIDITNVPQASATPPVNEPPAMASDSSSDAPALGPSGLF